MAQTEDLKEYSTAERTYEDDIKDAIDERVRGGLKKIYRGALQVALSGFGKGLLAVAAIAVVGIVALAVAAPATIGIATGLTLGSAVTAGLTAAGNTLLGSGLGLAMLAAGGVIGSLAEAHAENGRLSKENAAEMAQYYAMMREKNTQSTPAKAAAIENDCARGGHCNKLLKKREQQGALTR